MNFKEVKYYKSTAPDSQELIKGTLLDDTVLYIPKDPDNRHYAEILKQVKEGTLTIKDAD